MAEPFVSQKNIRIALSPNVSHFSAHSMPSCHIVGSLDVCNFVWQTMLNNRAQEQISDGKVT